MGLIIESDGEPWVEARRDSFKVGDKKGVVEFDWKDYFKLVEVVEELRTHYVRWRIKE